MHLVVLFFLFSIHFSDALNCIDGFTSVNNKCLRLISFRYTKEDVRRQCNLFGGNSVSIHNSIDNNAVAQFAYPNSDPIWIGLKCYADNATSCFWEDQLGNTSTYNNFVAGNPSMDNGQCVYMLTTGSLRGKWLSGKCDASSFNVVCESEPIGQCSHTYGGYCYAPLGPLTASEAQSACAQNCNGNLVSIHSNSENNYITSLFQDPSKSYIRIGLIQPSTIRIYWTDGSVYDFQAFGIWNLDIGPCYSMALVNEVTVPGLWLTSNCSIPLPSICKWLSRSSCVAPTLAPPKCNGPKSVHDNATETIYSPNYPYSYTATDTAPCYYIIYTHSTPQAAVWFEEFDLDPNASFEFYSNLDSEIPFATLNQSTQGVLNKTIISSTSLIKMVFKPCTQNCDQSRNYKWSASSGGKYPILNNTYMFPTAVFTSPNYPNQYSIDTNAKYLIASRNNTSGIRIRVQFADFHTDVKHVVKVYDGPDTSYPVLATLSGSYTSTSNLTFISSTRLMCITFITNGSTTSTGFLARFYDYL